MNMRCGKAQEFLSRAMDEALPADVAGKLERHLDACAECREYREDLQLGRRLLAGTEPALSENFEWRLQLRLSQAMQQAAADAYYPWDDPRADRKAWFRNFGTAASVGLAAVLALAMFLGPVDRTGSGPLPANVHSAGTQMAVEGGDRLPLDITRSPSAGLIGSGLQHPVSAGNFQAGNSGAFQAPRGWSGERIEDLLTIQQLRVENRKLANQLSQYEQWVNQYRAQLDRADSNALDLGEE